MGIENALVKNFFEIMNGKVLLEVMQGVFVEMDCLLVAVNDVPALNSDLAVLQRVSAGAVTLSFSSEVSEKISQSLSLLLLEPCLLYTSPSPRD